MVKTYSSVLFLLSMSSTELIHAVFIDVYLRHTMHIAPPNKDQSFGQQFNRKFIVTIIQSMQSLSASKPVTQLAVWLYAYQPGVFFSSPKNMCAT
jgi:hypothetical protein